ncbi:glycosyltransferase [Synechococcus sp. CCY 9618]|uniref:glycosyltransferase family 2 protein n=1 Tax=Synechococcus sp. CCY 9618 TaxID=2815602 RepID=UPI001C2214E4|nr:glycosyltransferase [Synechococcus sp. CCY 9618]
MATWHVAGPPQVSILCSTYNHIAFLRDAIAGFMGQLTSFPFEVILKDDASTDGTTHLVREFAELYPRIIRIHCNKTNEYNLGKRSRRFLEMARGRYLATCEGDDYWIHPLKLQYQWELLDAHLELIFCGGITLCGEDGATIATVMQPMDTAAYYSPKELIADNFLHNSTFFCRSWAWQWLFENFHASVPNGDRVKKIILATLGGAGFIYEPLSFYRIHSAGVWSVLRPQVWFEKQAITDRHIDRFTRGRYRRHFLAHLRQNYWGTLYVLHCQDRRAAMTAVPSMLIAARQPLLLFDTVRFYTAGFRQMLRTLQARLMVRLKTLLRSCLSRFDRHT